MSGSTAIRAAALVTMTALLGACQPGGEDDTAAPGGSPTAVPSVTAEPAPSGSVDAAAPSPVTAANTAAVCAAVDRLIIAKSREISADAAAATRKQLTPEQINAQVKADLADLADDVRGQASKARDPQIKELLGDAAKQLDAGAKSTTPVRWLSSTFVTIPRKLSADCRV